MTLLLPWRTANLAGNIHLDDRGVPQLPTSFIASLQVAPAGQAEAQITLPKISVVMPTYNQQQFIERSIISVLNQNYPNLEFIIIDGGSNDGTVDIIKKYETYLAYWETTRDEGQSDALNKGFKHATGEIYGWLNSDDLYLPGALFCVAEVFRANDSKKVVFGDWWEINGEDKVISVNYAFDFNLRHFIYEGFYLNSQAMFWQCDAHDRFGEFDVKLHLTMDYDLILRLGQAEGQAAFKRIPQPLACFRRHAAQKTLGVNRTVLDEHRRIASKNGVNIKYSMFGKVLRLIYRFRRAYWYIKRGGLGYLLSQLAPWCARRLCINNHREARNG